MLHNLNFCVNPGEKVDVSDDKLWISLNSLPRLEFWEGLGLARGIESWAFTSDKMVLTIGLNRDSTLALSFFRFVEATEGRILVDGLDIAHMGLTDLRTKLTIIPREQNRMHFVTKCLNLFFRGPDNIERDVTLNSRCFR